SRLTTIGPCLSVLANPATYRDATVGVRLSPIIPLSPETLIIGSLTSFSRPPTHALTHSRTHPLTHSPTHPLTTPAPEYTLHTRKQRMDSSDLLFWKAGPALKLSAPEVTRELVWGEEVDGLVDLPIREILDRLK